MKSSNPPSGAISGVILAAGAGTRLAPLTSSRPKAVIPTLDVPQLTWHLAGMRAAGATKVLVNAHHRAPFVQRVAAESAELLDIPVEVVVEPIALGTAGALKNLQDRLAGPFLLSNSDTITDVPLELLLDAHRSAGGIATVLAIPAERGADLVVEEGWVTELIDRRQEDSPGWIYGGAAVLDPRAIELIGPAVSGLFETVFNGALEQDLGLAAVGWEGYWRDIGDPRGYLRANMDALSGAVPPAVGPPGSIRETSYLGEGATGDLASVRHSVIGHDAVVLPGAELERCVVWDGTTVAPGRYRDAIIGDGCVVTVETD